MNTSNLRRLLVNPCRVVSGIQPTGIPHIGNYLGSLRQWVDIQNSIPSSSSSQCFFFIADLHALTVPQIPHDLYQRRIDMLAILLSIGIDPLRSTLFFQSEVPYHTELNWLMGCHTPMGHLNRMTQWKSKLQLQEMDAVTFFNTSLASSGQFNLGLFSYPVLQAADILLYGATHIPVGKDQTQHIELTRTIARKINSTYKKDLFTIPDIILNSSSSIMALKQPNKKMSKSDQNSKNYILLTDSEQDIRKKIAGAATDNIEGITYGDVNRPAINNLINITAAITDSSPIAIAEKFKHSKHSEFKSSIADIVVGSLSPFTKSYQQWKANPTELQAIAADGAKKATDQAYPFVKNFKNTLGLGV
ncbi:tryptophan-tRNA ligase Msw1 [Schizosaccharomyces cryophilus OY26]|uniref:tryptophan--tRNA ligase n=1 Tax=Schizosaccharomyces cryophilus (strain OY26 / ATCC MYA-4695 / CBS 11777 / NBRC 106824 / NRRL Y48691) TaxID=653667 RepID=S9W4E6_SCHCR|nr:tryptophan-tRNA ligase Msw1 [Schizosaccharomyces cryophilus OY26]EPY53384.1 tryptophan-tRNA ligase Msw1 [Schizosaccharomyces cryophilus OY26]